LAAGLAVWRLRQTVAGIWNEADAQLAGTEYRKLRTHALEWVFSPSVIDLCTAEPLDEAELQTVTRLINAQFELRPVAEN
jgi:hypothetical protein